jgi:hypothetical protein
MAFVRRLIWNVEGVAGDGATVEPEAVFVDVFRFGRDRGVEQGDAPQIA